MVARPDEERELLLRYREEDDPRAREELVSRFLPLARDLARRYSYVGEPFDDLLQVASLGLIKAIDRFDPARGTRFTSYAVPTILGELKRHFRDRCWAVHVPRGLQERAMAVSRETDRLAKRHGRSPAVSELASALGLSVEDVLEALDAACCYESASLDAPAGKDEADSVSLAESIGVEDPSYALVDDRDAVARGWHTLEPVERQVLKLRFASDLSQREIGIRVGCSQMQVSRLLRRGLGRLEAAARASTALTPAG